MVIQSNKYATICSEEGVELAKRVDAQESQVIEADGVHQLIMVLLSKEQSSRMNLGVCYQIKFFGGLSSPYKLILREDENLPLRRHTFRSDPRTPAGSVV